MPRVCVVLPTRNRLPLLQQAVESVRAQEHGDWELIIVDDGSTDATAQWIAELCDVRIRCISLPPTGDVGKLRNCGARAAGGDVVAFLDSDDLWEPAKLRVQLEHMQMAGVPWSYTCYDHIDEGGAPVAARAGEWRALNGRIACDILGDRTCVSIVTVAVLRCELERIGGFREGLRTREDFDLIVRLAAASETVAVPTCLAHVRQHAGRTTEGMGVAALHEASAEVCGQLALQLRDTDVARDAWRRRNRHLAQAGAAFLRGGSLLGAVRCGVRLARRRG